MSDIHYIKPRLPIISVSRGLCPHNHEYDIHIKIEDKDFYGCTRCIQIIEDWYHMSRDNYYEKYPEMKPLPDHTYTRVTLDEADKKILYKK